jgi:5-methylcytosine-specific restriction endonuclease McrA
MKEDILKLRFLGKTYDEISEELGCAKSTIAYHCSTGVKKRCRAARQENRRKQGKRLKVLFGGKCSLCSYKKCLTSLHFHHKDPSDKVGCVMTLLIDQGYTAALKEAEKCILVCSNCHGEIEENLRGTYS